MNQPLAAAEQNREGTEEALRASEARFRTLLNAVPDALFRLDRDGTYLDFKPARDFQPYAAPEHFLGKKVTDVLPPDHAARSLEHIRQVLETGAHAVYEYTLQYPDGARAFEARIVPAGAGEVAVIVRDVSERRRSEERMRELEAELSHVLRLATLGEMATELAHELTQPLWAITTFAAACANEVREQSPTGDGLLPKLEAISAAALRAGELIHRIRRFVSRGKVQRSRVAVNDLVKEVLSLSAPELSRHQVQVQQELGEGVPLVSVDPIQIQQVLLNLVRNAREAMATDSGQPRVLTVETAYAAGLVAVTVRDTGPGVAPAIAGHLFEPFQTTKPNGLGMGLAISRTLIEGHGGKLWVEPSSGRGAVFRFTLPNAAGEPEG